MLNWLHRLLHPHCEHCIAEEKRAHEEKIELERELSRCKTCDTLRIQLEHEQREKERLLEVILTLNSPNKIESTTEPMVYKPITTTRYSNFREKRRELESQDKIEYEKLEKLKKDELASEKVTGIEELESRLGINQ